MSTRCVLECDACSRQPIFSKVMGTYPYRLRSFPAKAGPILIKKCTSLNRGPCALGFNVEAEPLPLHASRQLGLSGAGFGSQNVVHAMGSKWNVEMKCKVRSTLGQLVRLLPAKEVPWGCALFGRVVCTPWGSTLTARTMHDPKIRLRSFNEIES